MDALQRFPAAARSFQLPAMVFTVGPGQIERRSVLAHVAKFSLTPLNFSANEELLKSAGACQKVGYARSSQRFDVVSFNPHRQRSLNRIDRNNQSAVPVAGEQHALDTIQRTAANSNSLPDFQERMRGPGNLLRDHGAQRLDLFVGNRNRFPVHTNDPKHSVGAIHAHALVMIARGTSLTKT